MCDFNKSISMTFKTATNQNGHKRKQPQTKTATKRHQNGHIYLANEKLFCHEMCSETAKSQTRDLSVPRHTPHKLHMSTHFAAKPTSVVDFLVDFIFTVEPVILK